MARKNFAISDSRGTINPRACSYSYCLEIDFAHFSPPSSITPIGLMSFTLSSSVKKETFIMSLT